jgi:hypothetical protein
MYCFQSALDLETNNIEALRSKVMCFWAMGQPHDAIMFSRMSLLIVPNDAMLLFVKASIEDNIGMAADAVKSYTSFIKNASAAMDQQINMAKARIAKLSASR